MDIPTRRNGHRAVQASLSRRGFFSGVWAVLSLGLTGIGLKVHRPTGWVLRADDD